MAKSSSSDFEDYDLPPTPPSSFFKRRYYDDNGKKTEEWFEHVPKSPLRHKKATKVNFKTSPMKPSDPWTKQDFPSPQKKRQASPERKAKKAERKSKSFDYRAFARPSKASERIRQKARQRRQDIPARPMPQSLSSTSCVPGKGFVHPLRISPRYYIVTGTKDDKETGFRCQVKEGGKFRWVTPDKVMKQSIDEYVKRARH